LGREGKKGGAFREDCLKREGIGGLSRWLKRQYNTWKRVGKRGGRRTI